MTHTNTTTSSIAATTPSCCTRSQFRRLKTPGLLRTQQDLAADSVNRLDGNTAMVVVAGALGGGACEVGVVSAGYGLLRRTITSRP